MNIFYKHATYLATLLLAPSIQCMLNENITSFSDSNATHIDLNNHTQITQALIKSANDLVNKKHNQSILAELNLFHVLVLKENEYQAAEKACLDLHTQRNNIPVKIALLNLLNALNKHNHAIETSLLFAAKIFIDHTQHAHQCNNLRWYAMHTLHKLIVYKNIELIPQETITAAITGSTDRNKKIQLYANSIINIIFYKWQYPALKVYFSEESDSEYCDLEQSGSEASDSDLNELEIV